MGGSGPRTDTEVPLSGLRIRDPMNENRSRINQAETAPFSRKPVLYSPPESDEERCTRHTSPPDGDRRM